jgi:hypothetical protein
MLGLSKIEQRYHSEPRFTLCLADEPPQYFEGNSEAEAVVGLIEAHFRARQRKQRAAKGLIP